MRRREEGGRKEGGRGELREGGEVELRGTLFSE